MLHERWRKAPRNRLMGVGSKPPREIRSSARFDGEGCSVDERASQSEPHFIRLLGLKREHVAHGVRAGVRFAKRRQGELLFYESQNTAELVLRMRYVAVFGVW